MRRPLVIAVGIMVAVVCAFFLGRIQLDASTPARSGAADANAAIVAAGKSDAVLDRTSKISARGTRSRRPFQDLQERADAGDVAAATRLYRNLSLCRRFRGMDWNNTLLANELLRGQTETMAPTQLEGYKAQLDAVESREQNMQRLHDMCKEADDTTLDTLVPALKKAAQMGEVDARTCYLALGPNYDARALLRHPEWLETYRVSVPTMIDAGMAAGDWKMLGILRNAYQPGAEGLLAGVLGSDPAKYYRYLKLSRLGAQPGDIDILDQQLAAAAARLPPERLDEANEWAESTFRRSFDGRSSAEFPGADWDPCIFPDK